MFQYTIEDGWKIGCCCWCHFHHRLDHHFLFGQDGLLKTFLYCMQVNRSHITVVSKNVFVITLIYFIFLKSYRLYETKFIIWMFIFVFSWLILSLPFKIVTCFKILVRPWYIRLCAVSTSLSLGNVSHTDCIAIKFFSLSWSSFLVQTSTSDSE